MIIHEVKSAPIRIKVSQSVEAPYDLKPGYSPWCASGAIMGNTVDILWVRTVDVTGDLNVVAQAFRTHSVLIQN